MQTEERAGFDGTAVLGASDRPVHLFIRDGGVVHAAKQLIGRG
ncbi:MAG: hypothetical protein QI223_08650 [Candidatus Korarchaeota archaeon]|nr:hypothetical protein [Candidatus Korarchaeota archaeon]